MENNHPDRLSIGIVHNISSIGETEWDACLLDTPGGDDHPFLRHRYLDLLERSGAIDGQVWQARYLTVRNGAGALVAAVPLFLKTGSFADFIYEAPWVQALENAGGRYYPRLVVAAPFAPVSGPRLLMRRGAPPELPMMVVRLMTDIAGRNGFSGVHATFVNVSDLAVFNAAGWHTRTANLFHWHNRGYADFDDFLATLTCRKRGMIRKERQRIAESGIDIHVLTGADLREEHMDAFARLYPRTFAKNNIVPHLPRDFFLMLGERMADDILLVMAREGGRWVGATLNFLGRRTLYCRSWGGDSNQSLLHFEVTNYRGMDYVIRHGLTTLDGGIGGMFKVKRGYQPVPVWSAHHFSNPALHAAVGRSLETERVGVERQMVEIAKQGPYRLPGER